MTWRLRFTIGGIAGLLLTLGSCNGDPDGIPRPASLEGADPQVAELIENGIAVIEEDPDLAFPRAGLGMIYQAHELFEPARVAYRQALAIEPDNARWLYHLARVERQLEDVDAAVIAISRSIELEPGYAPSYWRRGGWRLSLADVGAAEADFRKAIEIAPQDPAGHLGLARALIAQDRAQEAATLLAERHLELVEGDPWNRDDAWILNDIFRFKLDFTAQVQFAAALASVGREERALTVFEGLLQTHPTDARLLLHLGRTYLALERREEGLATLERGIEAHPRDPEMLGEAAVANHVLGQTDRALELLDLALKIRPDDGLAHARRGEILQDMEQYPQAAASYRRALIYRPQDTRLMLLYGDCLGHMGRYEAASEAYRYALTLDANNADLLARLGFMLHQLGRFADAEDALARALHIEPDHPGWSKLLEEWRQAGQG